MANDTLGMVRSFRDSLGVSGPVDELCRLGPGWWVTTAAACARAAAGDVDDDLGVRINSLGLGGGPAPRSLPTSYGSDLRLIMSVTPSIWVDEWAYRRVLAYDTGPLVALERRRHQWTRNLWGPDRRIFVPRSPTDLVELGTGLCQSASDGVYALSGYKKGMGQREPRKDLEAIAGWARRASRLCGDVYYSTMSETAGLTMAHAPEPGCCVAHRTIGELESFLEKTWTTGEHAVTIVPLPHDATSRPGPDTDIRKLWLLWQDPGQRSCAVVGARGGRYLVSSSAHPSEVGLAVYLNSRLKAVLEDATRVMGGEHGRDRRSRLEALDDLRKHHAAAVKTARRIQDGLAQGSWCRPEHSKAWTST